MGLGLDVGEQYPGVTNQVALEVTLEYLAHLIANEGLRFACIDLDTRASALISTRDADCITEALELLRNAKKRNTGL